jgi:hypothetical protein
MKQAYVCRDISTDEFTREFALMCFDLRSVQIGLLLCLGEKLENALTLTATPEDLAYEPINELVRLGFLKTAEVH